MSQPLLLSFIVECLAFSKSNFLSEKRTDNIYIFLVTVINVETYFRTVI